MSQLEKTIPCLQIRHVCNLRVCVCSLWLTRIRKATIKIITTVVNLTLTLDLIHFMIQKLTRFLCDLAVWSARGYINLEVGQVIITGNRLMFFFRYPNTKNKIFIFVVGANREEKWAAEYQWYNQGGILRCYAVYHILWFCVMGPTVSIETLHNFKCKYFFLSINFKF